MAQPFSGLWSGTRSCRRRCCVQEQHDLADHLAHDNPLGTLEAGPMDFAQPAQLLLDSINPCILRLHDLNLCGRGREIRRRCHAFKADQAALQRRQEEFDFARLSRLSGSRDSLGQ
jgi:hypothetical protein